MSKFDWHQELMVHDWPENGPGSLTLEKLFEAFQQRLKSEEESLTQEGTEISALRQDAMRYRWLRAQHWSPGSTVSVMDTAHLPVGMVTYMGDRLDAKIDELMNKG